MSKQSFKTKLKKAVSSRDYKRILIANLYPPYYEEGYSFYKRTNMQMFEVRKYRTWKYNRKTQWKQG